MEVGNEKDLIFITISLLYKMHTWFFLRKKPKSDSFRVKKRQQKKKTRMSYNEEYNQKSIAEIKASMFAENQK